jgi:hypothetical protein
MQTDRTYKRVHAVAMVVLLMFIKCYKDYYASVDTLDRMPLYFTLAVFHAPIVT